MKKLKKLKIANLMKLEVGKNEMDSIKGGDCCCGCNGPSSTYDNYWANQRGGGLHSPSCPYSH